MNFANLIDIDGRKISSDHGAYIVAEMSGNHGGELEKALELVRAAKRAGADALKIQTYTSDTITLNTKKKDFVLPAKSPWSSHKSLWELYHEAHTPWDWHKAIFEEGKKVGITVFSSPFDLTAVEFLESLDCPAYKLASPEITDIPLIKAIGNTGKPIIISTGAACLADIELALEALYGVGAQQVVLLKCTSAYPAPPEEANLLTIPDMVSKFGVVSGLSDHTLGSAVAITSVILGGSLIEKHFTLNNSSETVDSFFSLTEKEFSRLVQDVRTAERSLGQINYDLTPSAELSLRGRRSLYVSKRIKAGEQVSSSNIKSVRPSFGMHPKFYDEVLGRTVAIDLEPGDRLTWDVLN